MDDQTRLKQIYSAFSPAPLRVGQRGQKSLYVDLDPARGAGQVVRGMARRIRLASGYTYQVLAGHSGSGKSTELSCLRHELKKAANGAQRFFVVTVSAEKELDTADIDVPDLLIVLVQQVAEQLRERIGAELKPGYFRDRWSKIKSLSTSDVSLDSVKLSVGMASLSGSLKTGPEARKRVREALEADSNRWMEAANDVLLRAETALLAKGYAGLVVVFDDLDKMVHRPHALASTTTEYLFVHRAAQLKAFQCHVVYTMPIQLAYSGLGPTVKALYGGNVPVVPMTKLATRPPDPEPYLTGVDLFRQIIELRLRSVDAEIDDLFESDRVRDRLIRFSGGQPTELMHLIREAVIAHGLPIGDAGFQRCRTVAMRDYRRQLQADHWPLIDEVRRTGDILLTAENDGAVRSLLANRAILVYRNEGEWYGLNPAVQELKSPVGLDGEPDGSGKAKAAEGS